MTARPPWSCPTRTAGASWDFALAWVAWRRQCLRLQLARVGFQGATISSQAVFTSPCTVGCTVPVAAHTTCTPHVDRNAQLCTRPHCSRLSAWDVEQSTTPRAALSRLTVSTMTSLQLTLSLQHTACSEAARARPRKVKVRCNCNCALKSRGACQPEEQRHGSAVTGFAKNNDRITVLVVT